MRWPGARPPRKRASFTDTKTADTRRRHVATATGALRRPWTLARRQRRRHHHVAAGTYTLTIAGDDEDLNATGDLDVTEEITVNGAGAGTTTIDANGLDRAIAPKART